MTWAKFLELLAFGPWSSDLSTDHSRGPSAEVVTIRTIERTAPKHARHLVTTWVGAGRKLTAMSFDGGHNWLPANDPAAVERLLETLGLEIPSVERILDEAAS